MILSGSLVQTLPIQQKHKLYLLKGTQKNKEKQKIHDIQPLIALK